MSATRSHSLSIGIVGLPNSGKSTLFNSLTQNSVPAENFPFTTIDKNVGVVTVPDSRLDLMTEFYNAEKKVNAAIKFVDIAGLIKGASEGEGLGNQFLSHIREVDAIMYVLRGFESSVISHVYERIDPYDDFQIVQTELILKDLESLANKASDVLKKARVSKEREILIAQSAIEKLQTGLKSGIPALDVTLTEEELEYSKELWLLSAKPRIFLINIMEGTSDDKQKELINDFTIKAGSGQIILGVDVKTLGDMVNMGVDERAEFIEFLGKKPIYVEDIISASYERLGLITFYTGSDKECNAWSIVAGATAKEAAGVIHTDLMNGFITADIVNVEKLVETGGFQQAKEKGLVRNQGKEYVVQDGDYMIVYSN